MNASKPGPVGNQRTSLNRYILSLPERVVRSTAAVTAGLVRELGDVALPAPVRRSKLYRTMVQDTLRFLIEQVGQVESAYPKEGDLSEQFALRRAAGNGIELIGLVTFRASPVWVMAALADLSGTGRHLVREIADSLKQEGLLDSRTEFESVDHILNGLEQTSGRVADAVNMPPLDVPTLRRDWEEIRSQIRNIPPKNLPSPARLLEQWRELRSVADAQNRSVFEISSVMALSAIARLPDNLRWLSRSTLLAARRTGTVFAGPLLEHYATTLQEIRTQGFLAFWTRQFRPYLSAAASQFSRNRSTLTDRLLGRRGRG